MSKAKPYLVWTDYSYDGWSYNEYATLDEAVRCDKNGRTFIIAKEIFFKVEEVIE